MTRDQDIERVLDQWFTEGPTQMPSRFLDDTLDRIDRAPRRASPAFEPGGRAMVRQVVAAAASQLSSSPLPRSAPAIALRPNGVARSASRRGAAARSRPSGMPSGRAGFLGRSQEACPALMRWSSTRRP